MGRNKKFLGMLFASLLGASIALGGYMYFGDKPKVYQTIQTPPQSHFSKLSAPSIPENISFVESAEITTPAVVHVKTYKEVTYRNQNQYIDPFEYFFRDFFGDNYYKRQPQKQPQPKQNPDEPDERPLGFGSGVIIAEDGYIVTNNHVVDNADKVEVVLNDRRTFEAKIIGTDPTTDLALLKIEEENLPNIPFGNSDDIKVGEWVLAVGNPFNLTSTVTAGIVSAKARNINIIRDKNNMGIESFIQTDAAVNPGNSGGALVNLRGELIGINTAIQSQTGSFTGYAFAIPSALAEKVVSDLKDYGMVQRALLGIRIMPVTSELAKEKDLDNLDGVYIEEVSKNSAAKDGGLEDGDIILKINDIDVNSPSELQEQVARYRPGNKMDITYLRDGKIKTTEVTLKNLEGSTALIDKEEAQFNARLGASFKKPSKEILKELDLNSGIEVFNLRTGKLKQSGIKEGFIITAADKKEIKNEDQFKDILTSKKGGILLEGYYPNGRHAYYALDWK